MLEGRKSSQQPQRSLKTQLKGMKLEPSSPSMQLGFRRSCITYHRGWTYQLSRLPLVDSFLLPSLLPRNPSLYVWLQCHMAARVSKLTESSNILRGWIGIIGSTKLCISKSQKQYQQVEHYYPFLTSLSTREKYSGLMICELFRLLVELL